jgi:hypothetical protein
MDVIRSHGGGGVSEVKYNSQPDIQFELLDRDWLLSVKIGESVSILKNAFVQYQRHKDESGLDHGIILFLPDEVRDASLTEDALRQALDAAEVVGLIDAPQYKEEHRGLTFDTLLRRLVQEIGPRIKKRERQAYPLGLVISLLKEHVTELMEAVTLRDEELLRIITDAELLSGISGKLDDEDTEAVGRFLASYIFLSQVLFLALLSDARPQLVEDIERPVDHHRLRRAFGKVVEINYRPIYEIDVLDTLTEEYLSDTYDLLAGLDIQQYRFDLPGRIFHALMPHAVRKMLAAFYTRPLAADLLAGLSIKRSGESVMDPACGSGTILVGAYRRKRHLHSDEGKAGNPHKRYCEEELYGADIMPFARQLASANLAAMDPGTTISRTQIMCGDSLRLTEGTHSGSGTQLDVFPALREAEDVYGDEYEVELSKVDTVLMNPPFTKIERGIRQYVDLSRFEGMVGGEVGLWGHFIALADEFLTDAGTCGAVLPVNLLRGRESTHVRDIVFREWTPKYVLKATLNYGFSEWAEYRDVLVVASKERPTGDPNVSFGLIKKDLTALTPSEVRSIENQMLSRESLRSDDLDIETFKLSELDEREPNLMWFCGVSAYEHRDEILSFLDPATSNLEACPDGYFSEGFRPVPRGVSKFLFLTRDLHPSRTQFAFLYFGDDDEQTDVVEGSTDLGTSYEVEKSALARSLRTGTGLERMNLTNRWDYIARQPYGRLDDVFSAVGTKKTARFKSRDFWTDVENRIERVATRLVVLHRVNPYSPNTNLVAFYSDEPIHPSNVLNVINEPSPDRGRALCAVLNSVVFLGQFFLSKEETTGRYINIRFYDLLGMDIYPSDDVVEPLVEVYEKYKEEVFPALREQLDQRFDARYDEFRQQRSEKADQLSLLDSVLDEPIEPDELRLNFDMDVCEALGSPVTEEDLSQVYECIVKEMLITQHLSKE